VVNVLGVKEKTRKKVKETKEKKPIKIAELPVQSKDSMIERSSLKSEMEVLLENFSWVNHPEKYIWMYSIPTENEDLKLWKEEWVDFMIHWAKVNKIHVVSISDMCKYPPFSMLSNKITGVRAIAEALVEKKLGEFLDKNKTRLRIRWRSIDEWVEVVYKWCLKTGRLDLNLFEILDSDDVVDRINTLPLEEIKKIIKEMVTRKLAGWINKKRYHIRILV